MSDLDRHRPDARRFVRRDDVLWRQASGRILALTTVDDEVFELQGTGTALWDLLATPVTLREAATELADRFGTSWEVVIPDLTSALDELTRRGAVVRIDDT